jgi:hypothetical protein
VQAQDWIMGGLDDLEIITVREVFIVGRGGGRGGFDSRGGCCRDGGCRKRTTGGGGNLNGLGCAKDLADVDVVARLVNLGVVQVEDRAINSRLGVNEVAGIVFDDNIGRGTIFAIVAQADGVTHYKIGTCRVDDAFVDRGKLVRRNVMASRDAVTGITIHNGVGTDTSSSGHGEHRLCERRSGNECSGEGLGKHIGMKVVGWLKSVVKERKGWTSKSRTWMRGCRSMFEVRVEKEMALRVSLETD